MWQLLRSKAFNITNFKFLRMRKVKVVINEKNI